MFAVRFLDGHEERFACVLDAHDRMNTAPGAVDTVNEDTGNVTATPVAFDYSDIWRAGGW